MAKSDLLRLVLAAADDVGRVFDHAEITTWPPGSLDVLVRLGLLQPAATGLHAPCPNCEDGHIEPVTIRPGAGDAKRFFIWCPDAMRVEVTPEMCSGWEVDQAGLAGAVSVAMDLKGAPKAIMSDRLWRLGRMPWQGQTREVLLARRLADGDAATVATRIGHGGRSVVLVPYHVPDDRLWPGHLPAVVALSQIATVEGDHLVVDPVALFDLVAEADRVSSERASVSLDATSAKKVRRHVKDTIKSMLSDEALVQAYRTHNSYRKAADALNSEGYTTDRWAVERAVKAAGGPKAVKNEDDTGSVARTVASQSRDRPRKFLERR